MAGDEVDRQGPTGEKWLGFQGNAAPKARFRDWLCGDSSFAALTGADERRLYGDDWWSGFVVM